MPDPSPLPCSYVYALDVELPTPASAFAAMATGHQAQLREDLSPAWGLGNGDTVSPTPINLTDGAPSGVIPIRVHAVTPEADADSGAEAEHDDADGPGIDVFHDMIAEYGIGPEAPTIEDALSAAISHELIEERCDPACDREATLPDGRIVAVEPCDSVQAQTYRKNGVCVSNFNTPSNFAIDSTAAPFDFLGNQIVIFQCEPGGYEQVLDPNLGWRMITDVLNGKRGTYSFSAVTDPSTVTKSAARALIDAVPRGMLRYRLELAWRNLGRHAKRKRKHRKK